MPAHGCRRRLVAAGLLALWLPWPRAATRSAARGEPLTVDVAAPDDSHLAWLSAQRLLQAARQRGVHLRSRIAGGAADPPGLAVLPAHEFARRVPELDILLLPYFYPDLTAVHQALDGALGRALASAARERGWELLAVWDEGMHILSGNLAYTHPLTLSGAEFVILRDDPIAEKEFHALDSWTRSARPSSLPQLHKECVVSSRSATAQQIERERLNRVHLDLTLTRHRYEAWVLAMPQSAWLALPAGVRQALASTVAGLRNEQRRLAREAEASAMRTLEREGMTAHALAQATWRIYQQAQPAWESFLPASLVPESRRRLLGLAAGAAGLDLHRGREQPVSQPRARTP